MDIKTKKGKHRAGALLCEVM